MFKAIAAFFSSFFGNVKADPVSSLKGAVQLATAGAAAYGMATGAVPVNSATILAVSSFAASGIHGLGTNTATGVEMPAAKESEKTVMGAAILAPVALSLADQVAAVKQTADAGQQATAILAALAQVLPPVAPIPAAVEVP